MKKLRWLWFGIAILMIIQTPWAVTGFLPNVKAQHVLILAMVLGLAIRAAMIWGLLHLWWKFRPDTPKTEADSSSMSQGGI